MMGTYDDGGWSAATWLLMCLVMLVIWGGLVGLAIWVATSWRGGQRVDDHRERGRDRTG
jgi:hypothetical protein